MEFKIDNHQFGTFTRIIAQLINSALEFVTERVQTGALGNQLFAGQFNFLADRANFLASWVNFLAVPVNLKLSKIGSFPRKIRQKQTKVSSCKISKTYQIVEITYTPTGYLAASGLLFKRKIIWNKFRNQQLPPHFIPTQLVWIYILDFSWKQNLDYLYLIHWSRKTDYLYIIQKM